MSNKDHYHYLVSYTYPAGFGHIGILLDNNIRTSDINKIIQGISSTVGERMENIIIICMMYVDCDCKE